MDEASAADLQGSLRRCFRLNHIYYLYFLILLTHRNVLMLSCTVDLRESVNGKYAHMDSYSIQDDF
jgi:hypothetical protein